MRWLCSFFFLLPFQFVPVALWAQASPHDGLSHLVSNPSNPCRIDELLPRVTSHSQEFVENLSRFTATELLERDRLNREGKLRDRERSKGHYVVTVRQMETGLVDVEEYRTGTPAGTNFDEYITADAAPTLILIFHPSHVGAFDMTCDGPLDWHGRSTWQIHFQQRLDRPATMSALQIGTLSFLLLLKGSAWIDCDTAQILHLETDLMEPIPKIKLETLHQSVDFAPVTFSKNATTLWLPWEADVTARFKRKGLAERHTYSDFRLFSVETVQKIGKPAVPSN